MSERFVIVVMTLISHLVFLEIAALLALRVISLSRTTCCGLRRHRCVCSYMKRTLAAVNRARDDGGEVGGGSE
jgi:hypothetical protein